MSINFYPPSVVATNNSPDFGIHIDNVCKEIYEACKGWGTNNERLIKAIGNTTCDERHKISLRYKQLYDEELIDRMEKEASGDYGLALEYLACSPAVAECMMLKKAVKGAGCDEGVVSSILCGRSNEEMEYLKKTYYKTYSGDLGKLMSNEVGSSFNQVITACMQASEEPFDPNYHNMEKAREDAETIWKSGQGRWFGTDQRSLCKVVVLSPPQYLKMVNDAYAEKYGYTLFKALEKDLSGHAEYAALFTLGMKLKPYETVAALIKKACAGFGTNELLLTSAIIRYQDIMGRVNMAHIELYGKTVHERVRHECSGKYKNLLLTVLNKTCPEQ